MISINVTMTCDNCGKQELGEVEFKIMLPPPGLPPSIFPMYYPGDWFFDIDSEKKKLLCCYDCRKGT
jgi:hypothetical protein